MGPGFESPWGYHQDPLASSGSLIFVHRAAVCGTRSMETFTAVGPHATSWLRVRSDSFVLDIVQGKLSRYRGLRRRREIDCCTRLAGFPSGSTGAPLEPPTLPGQSPAPAGAFSFLRLACGALLGAVIQTNGGLQHSVLTVVRPFPIISSSCLLSDLRRPQGSVAPPCAVKGASQGGCA